jgi:LytR cell envelope-related transcriptional attenuator
VEHAQPVPAPFPWRATTAVAGAVALVELIALVAIGLAHLAPHHSGVVASSRTQIHRAAAVAAKPAPVRAKAVPQTPLRPRSRVRVLVLNGNGVSGAAATEAARLQGDGYRIGGSTNAARHDYANSMVMFVPGWAKEARRLARDTGIRMVSPVDGLRRAQLRGSTVILLLGT